MTMTLKDLNNIPALPAQFGPARQVAYIVPDMDAALDHWRKLGVSTFVITRNVSPLQNAFYRGEKSGPAPVSIAFGYMGDMQIELIQPHHDDPSIYKEALDRGISGVHHYAICVEDFPACYNYALDNGYEAVVDSGVDGLARMSYVENREQNIILEMIQWNDLTRPYFDAIHAMWKESEARGSDTEFKLDALTPKGAVFKALGGFIIKKLTGRVKQTRRTA